MEQKTNVSPVAKNVIQKSGGVGKISQITGRAESSIYKWTYPKEKGGTGGLIPAEAQAELMAASMRGEVDLCAEDFFEKAP